jgi:hypothetical protein
MHKKRSCLDGAPGERGVELVVHASREVVVSLVPTPPPINIVSVHFPDRDLAVARVLKQDPS